MFPPFVLSIFQFTTSHGGRRESDLLLKWRQFKLSIHDLTRRSTTTVWGHKLEEELSIHDLTRRSTRIAVASVLRSTSFNSRPHTEVDFCIHPIMFYEWLSIHDLTRRSTGDQLDVLDKKELSIHDLTRRSTGYTSPSFTRQAFQFTTSHGGRPLRHSLHPETSHSFNSRPHTEVDHSGA